MCSGVILVIFVENLKRKYETYSIQTTVLRKLIVIFINND
jgi:hypothetical protein